MRRIVQHALLGSLVFGAVAAASSSNAAVHALVVGINDYQHLPRLQGGVQDAQDIAAALQRVGAESVTLLLDSEATHDRIAEAWRQMEEQAQANDTLVFTYAGHGGQEPEKLPGSEPDGKDETFLLADFQGIPGAAGYRERIIDNEINAWFAEAGRRDIRVIFVADACHSGSMTRSPNARVPQSVRAAPPYGYAEPLLIVGDPKTTRADLQNVTFLSATLEGRKAPEVVIDGQRRGALSWAFARAIEGDADRNRDGVLTRAELEGYIIPAVRQRSEAQQTPEVEPDVTRGDQSVLLNVPKLAPTADRMSSLPMARLRIVGLDEEGAHDVVGGMIGASLAGPDDAADLTWDSGTEVVLNGVGDIAAHEIGISQLQTVIDKWRALEVVKQIALGRPLDMWLLPDDGRHPVGQIVRFVGEPLPQHYVTVFDMAPDGSVYFLYPLDRDRPSSTPAAPYSLELKVVPPFGADHLVVIASSEPLLELHRAFRMGVQVAELPGLLSSQLENMNYQIGIQSLYTTAGNDQ